MYNHFSFLIYLLPGHLSTDVEGLRSDEKKDLVQSRGSPGVEEKNSDGKRLVAQSVLLGGVSVLESMVFILLACGGKRNRTIVLDRREPHVLYL